MIPETVGEWPLVHQPDGKRWRTTFAYKHAKSVLKKSKAPKPLESLARDYNDDDDNNVVVVNDEPNDEEEPLAEGDPKLVEEDLYKKLRHYFRWASSAHRAMHDGFPCVIKV